MIQIKIDNDFLDLKEDFSIPLDMNLDLLDYTEIVASRILAVDIPKTSKNIRLTKYPTAHNFENIDAILFLNGNVFASIIILVTKVKELYLAISIKLGDDFFISSIKSKLITTIDPVFRIYDTSLPKGDAIYPDVPATYPYFLLDDYSLNYGDYYTTPPGGSQGFFFLGFILKKLFAYYNIYVEESIFDTDPVLQRVIIIWVDRFFQNSNHHFVSFFTSLPPITIDTFLAEISNLVDISFVYNYKKESVQIKKVIDVLTDKDLIVENGYEIIDFEEEPAGEKIKNAKFTNEYTTISFDQEINSVSAEINSEGINYSTKLIHDTVYVDYESQHGRIPYTLKELYEKNKLVLAFVDEVNREVREEFLDCSFQIDTNITNHFLHKYKQNRFKLSNLNTHKGECTLIVKSEILNNFKKGSKIIYNNTLYLVDKLKGNLSGNEYEYLKCNLTNI